MSGMKAGSVAGTLHRGAVVLFSLYETPTSLLTSSLLPLSPYFLVFFFFLPPPHGRPALQAAAGALLTMRAVLPFPLSLVLTFFFLK